MLRKDSRPLFSGPLFSDGECFEDKRLEVQPVDQARGPDAAGALELGSPACEVNAAAPPLHGHYPAEHLLRLDRAIAGC